jgi:hypothetical protein
MANTGKPMACSDGCVYYFETSKQAANIVDICYGYSAFKYRLLKIRKVKRNPNLLPIKPTL